MNDEDNKEIQTLGIALAGLGLFYFLMFEVLTSGINSTSLARLFLIFVLLLCSFFYSISMFGLSKKNKILNISKAFLVILWLAILSYILKPITDDINIIISSSVSFGLAWLLVIPLFGIPIISVACSIHFYEKNWKNSRLYWFVAIPLSLFGLFILLFPKSIMLPVSSFIIVNFRGWWQVLLLGIFLGISTTFITAPISPIFSKLASIISNIGKKNEL